MNHDDAARPQGPLDDSSQYERWYDGQLQGAAAEQFRARVQADPILRARLEADRAIDASLRRSFGAPSSARPQPLAPAGVSRVPWAQYATAASVLALFGAAIALTLVPHRDGLTDKGGGLAVAPVISAPPASTNGSVQLTRVAAQDTSTPRLRSSALSDVFLDALAWEFQPRVGCQMQDAWDAELYTQLASAPCNQEEGVVVLGEWVDPRLDVANMVMLRRGENPIMLVVPRCEAETELCLPKNSGLYLHRGTRDGRTIYEVSPVPGSEILSCVQAQSVVTQQQL